MTDSNIIQPQSVVAIGNALLDTEFVLDDDTLAKTGLVRGNMTLTDEAGQEALFDTLKAAKIEAVKRSGGGSAANSMAAFGSLGGRAYYHCRVADDEMGAFYLHDLAQVGVQTDKSHAMMAHGITGSCAVLITPDGERTMQTHLGASAQIDDSNINFETLVGADWLYLEGYLAMSSGIHSAITKMRQQAGIHGTKVAVSFSDPAVIKFAKEGLLTLLGNGVSAIFCNLEEAQLFTEKKQHKACAKALCEYADMAVVTNGAEPTVVAKKDGEVIEIEAVQTTVLDTNGAGDNYAGAFLYGLTEQYRVEDCGRLAAAVAAKVVGQFGARLAKEDYIHIKNTVLG